MGGEAMGKKWDVKLWADLLLPGITLFLGKECEYKS